MNSGRTMSPKVLPMRVVDTDALMDVRGLALHLADINGENWQTWTPERRAQIENIALTAMAAVKETGRAELG